MENVLQQILDERAQLYGAIRQLQAAAKQQEERYTAALRTLEERDRMLAELHERRREQDARIAELEQRQAAEQPHPEGA